MKWLVYILLLVNLGIFVWHYQGVDKQKNSSDALVQTTRLVLLKEYLARQEKEASSNRGHKGNQSSCYSLGPFSKKAFANKALIVLKKDGIKAMERVDTDSVRPGFWVFLSPSKSRKLANRLLARLRQNKEKDFFLVATGEMKNAISLGVFSKAKLAKARMEEINQQGFNARIDKVTLPKRVYWVDWDKRADKQPSDKLIGSLRKGFKGIGQTERLCVRAKNAS